MFSTRDALAMGLTYETLRTMTRAGRLERVTHGHFAPRDPTLRRDDLHRRHATAVLRRVPSAVLSHHSALLMARIPAFAADLSTVHLTHRASPSNRRRQGCVIHRSDHTVEHLPDDVATVRTADAVLQVGLVNPLTTLVAADPASESPAESLAGFTLKRLEHGVIPQVPILAEGRHYRVDFLLGNLVIEVDGMTKYLPASTNRSAAGTSPPPFPPQTGAWLSHRSPTPPVAEPSSGLNAGTAILAEKAREAALVRAGYPVLRLTWGEIVTRNNDIRYDNIDRMVRSMLAGLSR